MHIEIRDAALEARIEKQIHATGAGSVEETLLRLIEFDHQRPANLGFLAADRTKPTREHIHVVVRTPNGNDYGKDLLRQHYQSHPHGN